jgi:hypothetical protein
MANRSPLDGSSDPLSRLRRELWLQGWVGGGLFSALMVWVGMNWHAPHRVVNAERWELRDQAGRVRALMGSGTDGTPQLSFFDEEGRNLLQITAYPHAPEVSLSAHGHPRLLLSGLESGGVVHLFGSEDSGPDLILSPARRHDGPSD